MTSVTTDPREFHRNNFDFLRFVLAMAVLLSHCWVVLGGSNDSEPAWRLTRGQTTLGGLAVAGFFFISGFLITASWMNRPNLRSYLARRCARIYPGFTAASFVCALVIIPLATHGPVASFGRRVIGAIFCSATFNQVSGARAFAGNPLPGNIDAPLWTIGYEFFCYLALAAAGLCGVLRRRWVVAIAWAIVYLAMLAVAASPQTFGIAATLHRVSGRAVLVLYFLTGSAVYLYRGVLPHSHRAAIFALTVIGTSLLVPWAFQFVLPICGSYLAYYIAFSRWLPLNHFGRYGDFSYGIYLYAFPIQQFIVMWLQQSVTPLLLFAIAGPLAVAAGITSWYVVERHFVGRRRLLRDRSVPAPPRYSPDMSTEKPWKELRPERSRPAPDSQLDVVCSQGRIVQTADRAVGGSRRFDSR